MTDDGKKKGTDEDRIPGCRWPNRASLLAGPGHRLIAEKELEEAVLSVIIYGLFFHSAAAAAEPRSGVLSNCCHVGSEFVGRAGILGTHARTRKRS